MPAPPSRDALWRPTASLETLRLRAELLATARRFFAERGTLEVDTPALVRHAVTEPNLHSAEVHLPGHRAPLFLHTSPEYAMKRLLAAGSGDIFQIAHVFRGEERSRLHNAEFTLIEWYRCARSMQQLMVETGELAQLLLGLPPEPLQRVRYSEAFEHALGCDPLNTDDRTLCALALQQGLDASSASRCTRDELFDWLMATVIGPQLGREGLCFLHHYPASQAALARLDPHDPRVALRFELYCRGVELANGFEELADPNEQRQRFEAEQRERQRRGLPAREIDPDLLAALAQGLPPVSGVALGFDRLLLLRIGATQLSEVLSFPLERA